MDTPASQVVSHLKREKRTVVDLAHDADWLLALTPSPSKLLAQMHRNGLAHPIQRGRHWINLNGRPSDEPDVRNLEDLAGQLLALADIPYYVSWHASLWHYELIDQQARSLSVATQDRKRPAQVGDFDIRFVHTADSRFFGWVTTQTGTHMATMDKALVDSFTHPHLAGGMNIVLGALWRAWQTKVLDPASLVETAVRLDSPFVNRRLGYAMARMGIPGTEPLALRVGRTYATTLNPGDIPEDDAVVDSTWRVYEDAAPWAAMHAK